MQLSIGRWRLDFGARTAKMDGNVRRLSPRAMRLLEALAEANGATVSRAELLDKVWPDVLVGDDSLTQAVAEVRKELDDRKVIETVARCGYRLTQPVLRNVAPAHMNQAPSLRAATSLEALTLCLEARDETVRCGPGSLERAETLTAEAVDLAPECPVVRADHAIALARSHMYWSGGRNLLNYAMKEAELAVALDRSCARAHSTLGYVLGALGKWEAAEAAHAHALSLDRTDATCFHYAAWLMMSRCKYRAAIAFFEHAGDLETQNIKGYLQAARLSLRYDPARSRKNAERALARARARLAVDGRDTRALTATGVLMALMGEPGAAFATLDEMDVGNCAQAVYHASTFAMLGELDRAVLMFECLFDHGWRDVHWLDADPAFANIAGDRRFKRMRNSLASA